MMTDQSPSSPTAAVNGGVIRPQYWRPSLSSAWASIVRGDSEQIASPTLPVPVSSSPSPEQGFCDDNAAVVENSCDGDVGIARKTVWKKPNNDVVENRPVMGGAISWPALSESTRPVPRSSTDPGRPSFDGSPTSSSSPSQVPIISQPWRDANINPYSHSHSTIRNRVVVNGASSLSTGGGPSPNNIRRSSPPPPPPPPPPFPIFRYPREMIPPPPSAVIGTRPIVGGEVSRPHMGNGRSRNVSRKGNFGPRSRGDVPFHGNHAILTPRYGPPPPLGYMPPPLPPPPPFLPPPPMRIYPDMTSFIYVPTLLPESFRAMPIVTPPPPPLVPFDPPNSNHITKSLLTQIDYYFSDINLVTDKFLRSNMDDHGWVPVSLIASFPRVRNLTQDVSLIMESMRFSNVVEVEGDKLRKRNEWNKWLNTPSRLGGDTPENAANEDVIEKEVNTDNAACRLSTEEPPSSLSRIGNEDDSISG